MARITKRLDTELRGSNTLQVTNKFKHRIFGQNEAVEAFTNVLERFLSGTYDRSKPIGSLLYLGPTGTGKTATVEAAAEGLFGDPNKMLKIDCAEFQHSHEVAKLIGSPPGYLGHRETPPLFTNEKMKNMRSHMYPFSIVLWDEIEKASDAVWNILLGILDKGQLTTGSNEIVDLKPTIQVMTSNVGSQELADRIEDAGLGFNQPSAKDVSHEDIKRKAHSAAKRKFMPEFLNRLDEIVVFKTLDEKVMKEVLFAELGKVQINVQENANFRVRVVVTTAATDQLLKEGQDKKYNARYMKRTINIRVTNVLARVMSSGQLTDGDIFVVDFKEGQFEYHQEIDLEYPTQLKLGIHRV